MRRLAVAGIFGLSMIAGLGWAAGDGEPDRAVEQAKARARSIPAQADALARLAWLDGAPDPVRQRARQELAVFGEHAVKALWHAVVEAPPEYKAEVVETLIQAYLSTTAGQAPADYLPALEDGVWFGTREARMLAIPELAKLRSHPSVLPIIDAALEDPEVEQAAVQALGAIGDPRARFFLSAVLESGRPFVREQAAVALSRLGDEGRTSLKSAMRSPDKGVRLAAVRALLPVATVDDATVFYEYLASHEDDDPATSAALRNVTLLLERAIEMRQAAESATSGPR